MADNRATKSGVARDNKDKIDSKFDAGGAGQVLEWIRDILADNGQEGPCNCDGSMDNVYNELGDGLYLGRLSNVIVPGTISEAKLKKPQGLAFKKMEMIGQFIEAAKKFGVPDTEVFQTVDLYEKVNIHQVILCLAACARKAQSKGMRGFGPKESTANVRNFTEEQLKAGQNVIGLQMGSNKGANQSGQNFGKGRMIID